MTAHRKKEKKELVPYRIRVILVRVVRFKNRFVGTLDWTTIHEEPWTEALAEAATTAAAAAAPATVPREYYTPLFPPCHRPPPRPPSANIPLSHPRAASAPSCIPSRFHRRSPLLAIHEHPTRHPKPFSSPFLRFAPSRVWLSLLRAAATPTTPTRGVVRAVGRGRPRTKHV